MAKFFTWEVVVDVVKVLSGPGFRCIPFTQLKQNRALSFFRKSL